jgi:hypothetical protein
LQKPGAFASNLPQNKEDSPRHDRSLAIIDFFGNFFAYATQRKKLFVSGRVFGCVGQRSISLRLAAQIVCELVHGAGRFCQEDQCNGSTPVFAKKKDTPLSGARGRGVKYCRIAIAKEWG